MIDWTKWKLVPVEATDAMFDAAHKEVACDAGIGGVVGVRDAITAAIAAAPPAPVVEVTIDTKMDIGRAICEAEKDYSNPRILLYHHRGHIALAAVQQVLGPQLGMVTREEMAREVEAAFREGWGFGEIQPDDGADLGWQQSNARKALGGGE